MLIKRILKIIQKYKIFLIISKASYKLKYKTYVIGGFTRNIFINKNKYIYDIDIVTTGDSILLAKKVSRFLSIKNIFIFKRFKTVILKYKNLQIEIVSTRKEYYSLYNNKPYVEILNNIREDQKRRDFTINTIAISLNKKNIGKIIDPYNGIKDIKKKIIKTPVHPDKVFYDDPLRMIRAIRFSCELNFRISKKSLKSIKKNKYRIRIVSIERIMQEFNKILLSKKPSIGIILMNKIGFLSMYFSELLDLDRTEKINNFTYKNNFIHTLNVLDTISNYTKNLWLRWATLLHDIGKPVSKKLDKEKGWTFYHHEIIGSNMVPYIFHKLKLPTKNNMKYIQTIIKFSNIPNILIKKDVKTKTIRKFIYKIGFKNIEDLLLFSKCDITTKNINKKKKQICKIKKLYIIIKNINKKDKLHNLSLPIDGNYIINLFKIKPSKVIGIIKKRIINSIIKGKVRNNLVNIVNYIKKIGPKIIKLYDKN